MGWFSSDEIVTNTTSTLSEVALLIIAIVLVIYMQGKIYARYAKKQAAEMARREITLYNIKTSN